jgi:hypothetical protein
VELREGESHYGQAGQQGFSVQIAKAPSNKAMSQKKMGGPWHASYQHGGAVKISSE